MPKKKAKIGDILEVKTPLGLVYMQYTHEEVSMGAIVRILPGFFSMRPRDFTELARQHELYFTFYTLRYAVPNGDVEIVSNQPVPHWAEPYPMMRHSNGADRTGKTHSWKILRADTPFTLDNLRKSPNVVTLTPDLAKLSIHALWTHPLLAKRLAQSWTPERAEDLRLKAIAAEARTAGSPQSKVLTAHVTQHYLYFPEESGAEQAAQWFRSQGFVVEVRRGADGISWLALVKHDEPEGEEALEKLRHEMEAIAERLNGEYDGWETAV
jgi:hypothetical protein